MLPRARALLKRTRERINFERSKFVSRVSFAGVKAFKDPNPVQIIGDSPTLKDTAIALNRIDEARKRGLRPFSEIEQLLNRKKAFILKASKGRQRLGVFNLKKVGHLFSAQELDELMRMNETIRNDAFFGLSRARLIKKAKTGRITQKDIEAMRSVFEHNERYALWIAYNDRVRANGREDLVLNEPGAVTAYRKEHEERKN